MTLIGFDLYNKLVFNTVCVDLLILYHGGHGVPHGVTRRTARNYMITRPHHFLLFNVIKMDKNVLFGLQIILFSVKLRAVRRTAKLRVTPWLFLISAYGV